MKKILILFLCLILTTIPVWGAYSVDENGVEYTIEGSNTIAEGRAKGNTYSDITIWGNVIGGNVAKIADEAFQYDPYLSELTVGPYVREIGVFAFSSCLNLTTVTFIGGGEDLCISNYAFSYCPNLTSVTLPTTVGEIGMLAFYNCDKFKIHYLGTKEQWERIGGSKYIDISRVDLAVSSGPKAATIKASKSTVQKGKKTTVKINTNGGTITIKGKSKKAKNKKYVKIKNNKITFQKKAPKGTYKFTVTSAAKGNYKKTTKTISIKVK